MNSVIGLTSPKTFKVAGTIGRQGVVVLVDSGATHNFMSVEVITKLGLRPVHTSGYGVFLGNGLTVQGEGICQAVTLYVQNLAIVADFLPLELGSADVVLGIQWLRTLGQIQFNFSKLEMRFFQGATQVTIQGDPGL
ncbi:PREDICTED: uncharacterized protein LOC104800012 [Tarenaya hassleriana]|uniref:uncharacterized protein LOC104800012 n=1 Tax=Tarenaya hassleriana TaxID=28532 RepID=UPI00053C72A4|nr:PREDICTED: uncharacterized protein LOC104800012 [Tarenaya hassleriana]